MNHYWNQRYTEGGRIWGIKPSNTAVYALNLFLDKKIREILIPGAGYGRNSKIFSDSGLDITGIELANEAYKIAQNYDPKTKFILGSFLEHNFNIKYDAIYCFNVLHLFNLDGRLSFLSKCKSLLKANGYIFLVVFSEKEDSFGRGKKTEKNTYESKTGRPVHYFTENDLKEHFIQFTIIETGIMEDNEDHGDKGPHTHILRYIFAQKSKS